MRYALVFALGAAIAAADAVPVAGCANCHRKQTAQQPNTDMGKALTTAAESAVLQTHPKLTFAAGRFSYEIKRSGDTSIYTVREGGQEISIPIPWAFGLGAAGQTYLLPYNGKWYESRVSYYKSINGLDFTLGAHGMNPTNLEEALGKETRPAELALCFGCHTTGSVKGPQVDFGHLTAGVLCEACHGPAAAHVSAIQAGNATRGQLPRLSKLTAEETFELCGRCHRTWTAIASQGPVGVENVRFQPYRLTNSKCYDAYDPRISCVACHDPHSDDKKPAAFYDGQCQQCHGRPGAAPLNAKVRLCRIATKDCVSCHMPRYEIPGSHHRFSDHQIRIVRPGDGYPN